MLCESVYLAVIDVNKINKWCIDFTWQLNRVMKWEECYWIFKLLDLNGKGLLVLEGLGCNINWG